MSQGDRSERLGEIVVGRDGSVWHYAPGETCDKCPGAFYRLGASATHRWPDSVASVGRSDIAKPEKTVVALDGTVWAIVGPKDRVRTRLMSFDGQAWKEHEVPGRPHAIDVDASGTPWITTHRRGPEVPPEGRFRTRSLGPDGSVTSYRPGTLAASPRGEVLLNETTQAFWTREGDGWAKVAHRADGKPPPAGHARIDDDGTIWTPTSGGRPGTDVLDRFDDSGWSTVAREDGRDWSDLVGVAADGSVWFDQLECEQGLLRFDGATWQQHLDGYCPTSIDYAADGSVWVQAVEASTTGSGGPVDTFVITPDAVATVE